MIPSSSASQSSQAAPDWQRLKDLVGDAQALPEPERRAFLVEQCEGDELLLKEALQLLGHAPDTDGFLNQAVLPEVGGGPLDEGDRVGAFRILSPIGAGGMGDVYLAERADDTYEERVAVKVIRLAGGPSELRDRFLSERRLMAELRHPNIARLLDAGSLEDGRPYFVMELVDGEPIDLYCARRGLSLRERLGLMIRVAEAVAHAHRHLVIHRDLKPGNIFVTQEGVPKLLDFGVAKDLSEVGKTPSTRLLVPLTPEYASPEQLTGGAVTTASDVYSLGVVLYELLTGSSPFGGVEDPMSGRSQSSPPTRPSSRVVRGEQADRGRLRRQLTGDLDSLVLKALDPDPSRRYSSVEALQRDLQNYLDGLPLEARGGWSYRVQKWLARHWRGTLAAAVAVALVAGWWLERSDRRLAQAQAQMRLEQGRQVADTSREMGKFVMALLEPAALNRSGNAAALELLDHIVELLDREETFEGQPLLRAAFQGAAGQTLRQMGRAADAEPRLRECLDLRQKHLPTDHPEVALAANNLGVALLHLGRNEEASGYLQQAESILRRTSSDEHLNVLASALSNLASIEKSFGRNDSAIAFFRKALNAKIQLDPGDHATIANAHKNLAAGLYAAGRLEDAHGELELASERWRRSEEPDLWKMSSVDYYLGLIARDRGDLQSARVHLQAAYEIRLSLRSADQRKTREAKEALNALDALPALDGDKASDP